ncbi:disease resistance-like protein CSA1 [Brassica napus]|uniref:disease resistance-like protein CSA1 n=1 Tax=Brassica napus TaxID=3708 RepID=UPI0020786E04|nr:disease resistance-like protein CSA1 [Brassica napus]
MVVSSSSVQSSPPQHQVFINFRGKQLRNGFVSHLEKALRKDGINVFIDKNETKGKDLSILFSRIEESRIALAIFSTLYTESNWCLNELEKIKECVDLGKLVVIPIFYKVETDDVKNLKGVFGDKFWELAKTCRGEKLDKWKEALEDVPKKLGFTLSEMSDEGEYISKIVGQVMKVLSDVSAGLERDVPIEDPSEADPDSSPLYGIETRLKQLEEKLEFDCESTLTVGVVGMPGIGKTTLTKMLYEKWQHKFLRCVFLHDVRKLWQDRMMDRNIFMRELLKDDDLSQQVAADLSPESLKALLLSKKSLVVLDNVTDKKQIEVLLGECDWIKKGSLIFITTSDKSVIEGKVDDTYEVLRLSGRESFQYFSYFAFGGGKHYYTPKGNFMNLSRLFADYAKGNPLALKILGVELNGKDETHWEDKLSKLAQSPDKTIQNVLQISYDGLSELHKNVFLDVACFFRSGDEYYVKCLVESCDSEIKDLASKFFINISGGRVEMHDLLYTFGKELGLQGSRRLWNHKGVVGALKKRAGAESVRGIFLDMSELKKKLPLEKCTFSGMRNLRYLKFYNSCCHRECEAGCKLSFPEGLEFPLDEVRYLYWLKFPLKKLPKDFNPKNLTDLSLPYSEIEEIWEGVKATPKLKWVDLSHSSKLSKLSGLQNAESLQRVSLEGCKSLQELPREMNHMKSLVFLNMRGCTSLRFLPHMNLISMKTLILTNCSSLQEFRVISDNLETLKLDGTAISQLPANMVKLQRLMVLNLKDCIMLEAVPESLGKLKKLQELVLSGCSKLKTFPIPIENMKRLQILLLDTTAITDMPKILQFNSQIKCGMNGLSSLRHLCLSRNNMITNLQVNISQLHHLRLLDVKYCKNLTSIPLLPPNLEVLDAHGCEKLKTVATPLALLKLMEQVHSKFIFTNCNNLEQVAKNSITVYAQRKSQQDAVRCYKEGNVSEALLITSFPGSEVPSWFNHRTIGSSLKLKFPPHWCDNRLSTIVLCAVVSFPCTQDEINRFSIECTCEFTNELGTCVRFSCTLGGGWIEPREIDSDHVFIGYTSCSHLRNHVEGSGEHHKCVPTEASIEFEVRDGAGEIVNCGLSLVYEEPNHAVTEGDYNGTSSRRDFSVGESIVSFAVRFVSTVLKYLWLLVAFFLVYGFAKFFFFY